MLTLQHIKHRLPSEYVFLANENKNNKNKQRKNNMMKVCFFSIPSNISACLIQYRIIIHHMPVGFLFITNLQKSDKQHITYSLS